MKIKFFIILFVFLFSAVAFAEEQTFYINNVLPDKAGKLLFIGSQNSNTTKISYKSTRLAEPARLVIDIENAVLKDEDGKMSVKFNNKNFPEEIRIAQFSTEPYVVRVVLTADSVESLDKIKIDTSNNALIVKFDKIELVSLSNPSIYRDKEDVNSTPAQEINLEKAEADNKAIVIKKIKESIPNNITINTINYQDNVLQLSGRGIISVVEPFVLDSPDRIIFDITDAVLNSSELIQTYSLKNTDTARIAQFDTRTVRIVIESQNPAQYTYAVSPDLQSIVISPKDEISFSKFPDNASIGELQDLKVIKDSDLVTNIILISKKPIIHSIERLYSPDKVSLNLYNVQPLDEKLNELEKTSQFQGFEITGSTWSMPLNPSTHLESRLSLDGRVLKLTLTDDEIVIPVLTTGSRQAKIVIDPGHGGYDPGAGYNGIYEKDLVLDISKRVKKYLDEQGLYVILTRETDKTMSLKERVELTNKEKPDLFLSVHANASNNPDVKGIETHWYTLQSRPLAMQVQNKMANMLVTPDRGLKNSRFYVIRHTQTPAVLTEIGYMSNEIEMYQLMTEERRESTAKAIADGILNFLKTKDSGSDESTGRKQL